MNPTLSRVANHVLLLKAFRRDQARDAAGRWVKDGVDVSRLKRFAAAGPKPLFVQVPGESHPRPAYLTLDEDGIVDAHVGPAFPSMRRDLHSGVTCYWRLPSDVSGKQLAALAEVPQFLRTMQNLHSLRQSLGGAEERDGRGPLTPETEMAEEAVAVVLEQWL